MTPENGSQRDGQPYPSRKSAAFTLAVLVLAYLVSFIDRQALSLMVDPIRADLDVTDFQMSLLQGFAFALFFCVLGIPLGRLADRASRKHVIAVGVVLWSLMTVACGFAGSFATLFLFRMGVGVGEAALAPAAYSILSDTFPRHRLVRATSIFSLGAMAGAGFAFLLGGSVLEYVSSTKIALPGLEGFSAWQATFVIIGVPGLLVALLVLAMQEPARRGVGAHTPLRFSDAVDYLWKRRGQYLPLYAVGTMMAVLSYGGLSWFPTHLIRTYGLSPGQVGLVLGFCHLAGPLIGTLGGAVITEKLMARGHSDAPLITISYAAAAASLTFCAPLMPTLPLSAAVWFLSVIAQNAYYGNVLAALQMITPNRLRATNSAFLTLCVTMGGLALGTALIGGIADLAFPGNPRGIGNAMAIVGMVFGILACITAIRGRHILREAMAEQIDSA